MENKKRMEGNRLIAEFMGAVFDEHGKIEDDCYPKKIPRRMDMFGNDIDQFLEYEIAWDFLMPVVEKVAIDYEVTMSSVGMWVTYIDRMDSDMTDNRLAEMGGMTAIENTWEAIVQLMKWRKKQPKYKVNLTTEK